MQTCPVITTEPPHYGLANIRAIDGDTLEASIILPLGIAIRTRIRLRGFYAPEHHGAMPDRAREAQRRLQAAVDAGSCHLLSRGMKQDIHGRHLAHLLIDGRGADPHAILGDLQMSADAHASDLITAKRRNMKRGAAL